MAVRTARTAWKGSLNEGSGRVELTSSGVGEYDVSFPRRTSDTADGVTSPEELVAAAHTSCYAMQFSGLAAKAGGTPQSVDVTADVTVIPDPAGGLRISTIHLTVRAEVDGLDADGIRKVAEETKDTCPVSKALAGVDTMTVEVVGP